MREIRPSLIIHMKYSEDPKKQKAMEDLVDTITASVLDLVSTVIHRRMCQFAQLIIENVEKD